MLGKTLSITLGLFSFLSLADARQAVFFKSRFGTEARALSQTGSALGVRETLFKTGEGFVTEMIPVVWVNGSGKSLTVARLDNYSNYHAYGLSDSGMVAGRAIGRGGSPVGTEGFVWTSENGSSPLGYLPGGTDSAAHAIAGNRVAGFSNKQGGGRFPCVWNRSGDQAQVWKIEELPLQGTGGVAFAISPDGKWISGEEDFHPVAWTEIGGRWVRKDVSKQAGSLLAINNRGEAAGFHTFGTMKHAIYVSVVEKKIIDLNWGEALGYDSSEALGINAEGTVVGNQRFDTDSDAFVWKKTDSTPQRFRLTPDGHPLLAEPSREGLAENDDEVLAHLVSIGDNGRLFGQSTRPGNGDEIIQMFLLDSNKP